MNRYDFYTLDFLLFLVAAIVVLIYKTYVEFSSKSWLQGLNRPFWALDLVPFTAAWALVLLILVIAIFRAYHFSEHEFGLFHIPDKRQTFVSASIDVGYILTLFHILVWSQNFFVNRDPQTAFQNGIIFVASMFWLMAVCFAADVIAGLLMIIVCLWGVYVLAYNWYIINNNKFLCSSIN